MRRHLFSALSLASALLCLLLCLAWVRGQWASETFSVLSPGRYRAVTFLQHNLVIVEIDDPVLGYAPEAGPQWRSHESGAIPMPPTPPGTAYPVVARPYMQVGTIRRVVDMAPLARAAVHEGVTGPRTRQSVVEIWYAPPALLSAILPSWWLLTRRRRSRRRAEARARKGLCPACGYDLRGAPGRCPECGVAAATGAPPVPPAPTGTTASPLNPYRPI